MIRWTLIICLLISCTISSFGQREKILKGVSEFRKSLLQSYSIQISQNEEIRKRLDTLGVDSTEYIRFLFKLFYVSRNLNKSEKPGYQYFVDGLKSHRIYNYLTEKEIAILIDNFHLLFIPKTGIWGHRYPHNIKPNAHRIAEINDYGIEEGDSVLHYDFYYNLNALCPILYSSYENIHVVHYPVRFSESEKIFFHGISNEVDTIKSLEYPPIKHVELDESQKYDVIVFDGLGFITYRLREGFKKKFKQIHRLLKDDGVLVMGGNAQDSPFDGPFELINRVDEKIKDVYKLGFELKEKILVENEYAVYKLVKK